MTWCCIQRGWQITWCCIQRLWPHIAEAEKWLIEEAVADFRVCPLMSHMISLGVAYRECCPSNGRGKGVVICRYSGTRDELMNVAYRGAALPAVVAKAVI
jgi:hypothetical protein